MKSFFSFVVPEFWIFLYKAAKVGSFSCKIFIHLRLKSGIVFKISVVIVEISYGVLIFLLNLSIVPKYLIS